MLNTPLKNKYIQLARLIITSTEGHIMNRGFCHFGNSTGDRETVVYSYSNIIVYCVDKEPVKSIVIDGRGFKTYGIPFGFNQKIYKYDKENNVSTKSIAKILNKIADEKIEMLRFLEK